MFELKKISDERGQTLAEMSLAWLLNSPEITSVLIGASRKSQLLDNLKSIENTTFTAEELEKIENIALRK